MFAPRSDVSQLVSHHELTQLATLLPFEPLSTYGESPNKTGDPALTEVNKAGTPYVNFNNRAYIGISNHFLKNDIDFVEYDPVQYAKQVIDATGIWLVPADQVRDYSVSTLGPYRDLYDLFVQWQPSRGGLPAGLSFFREDISWTQISLLQIFIYGSTLLGIPLLIVRNWRRRRDLTVALLIPGLLFLQPFVVMNLIENGENNRFRFEAGTVSITLSLYVVVTAVRHFRSRAYHRTLEGAVK